VLILNGLREILSGAGVCGGARWGPHGWREVVQVEHGEGYHGISLLSITIIECISFERETGKSSELRQLAGNSEFGETVW
jgi:hypothetical protein